MNNLPKYNDFKDSLVAFIDILGFNEKVLNINSENEFSYISNLLYSLQETAKNYSEDNSIFNEYEITAISDSLIISVPYTNPICTYGMLVILHKLQYELLATNFKILIRGYITRGKVYHKNGFIFGEGYSKAYEGERLIGGAPRIILDQIIVQEGKKIIASNKNENNLSAIDYILEDKLDGNYFIDYLNPIGSQLGLSKIQLLEERNSIKLFIEASLIEFSNNEKIKSKYEWLENYFYNCEEYYI